MPAILVGVWVAVFLALLDGTRPAREAALVAFTVVSLAVLFFTQTLSLFGALSFGWLATGWIALLCMLVIVLRRPIVACFLNLGWPLPRGWGLWDWAVAVVLGAFAIGTLLAALLYPTTNYDSLTYHMPRVFFWFQNHSVAHYPTAEARQLFSSAFAEYFILNLKILVGGSDRLGNTVQWLSYIFSVLGVSLIALGLGASRRGQQLAAVATAAMPMAVLQASTTQNDLTCALWCIAFAYCVVTYIRERPATRALGLWWAAWAGCTLGLALQTKPTAYLACAPFAVWLAIAGLRRDGWKWAGGLAAVTVAFSLLLMAGWYVGNAQVLGGDILGLNAPGNSRILIQDRRPSSLLTNTLENASNTLGSPSLLLNGAVEHGVRWVAGLYGGTAGNPDEVYAVSGEVVNQDYGPFPVVVLLVSASLLVLLILPLADRRLVHGYLACGCSGLLLIATLIVWNPWTNRLMMGPVLLLMPLVGVATSALEARRLPLLRGLLLGVLGLSVLWGAAAMLFDSTNRLVPPTLLPVKVGNRDLGYWNTSWGDLRFRILVPHDEQLFKMIAQIVTRDGFQRVGINAKAGNVAIYPLLSMLSGRHVEYVGDTVLKDKISAPDFKPQVILEVIDAKEFPQQLKDGTRRGEMLFEPTTAGGEVFLLYRAP